MTDMIERVARAIEQAQATRAYGLYDYSSYPGALPPHVVRDELLGERSRSEVLRTADPDEAREVYERLCREFVARAAIEAMTPPNGAMVEAAVSAFSGFHPDFESIEGRMAEVVESAIDAALAPSPPQR